MDGRVIEGASDVSEPALTGESAPRLVQARRRGLCGIGRRRRRAGAGGGRGIGNPGEPCRALDTGGARPSRAGRDCGRPVRGAFVPGVALIALASALAWGLSGSDWARGGLAALSVLVVACPCALGIATPMATTIAVTRAAGRGILLRSGAVLEALDHVRLAAFDKTGTITRGRATVRGVWVDPASGGFRGRRLGSFGRRRDGSRSPVRAGHRLLRPRPAASLFRRRGRSMRLRVEELAGGWACGTFCSGAVLCSPAKGFRTGSMRWERQEQRGRRGHRRPARRCHHARRPGSAGGARRDRGTEIARYRGRAPVRGSRDHRCQRCEGGSHRSGPRGAQPTGQDRGLEAAGVPITPAAS